MSVSVRCPDGRSVVFEGSGAPSMSAVMAKCAGVNKGPVPGGVSASGFQSFRGPGATQFPGGPPIGVQPLPDRRFDVGGALGDLAKGGCDYLPEGFFREQCKMIANRVGQDTGNGNGGPEPCPDGTVKIGNRCVAPGDAFPGGDPFTTPAGQQAVQGSFGMPAITPTIERRVHRTCPTGMVLGRDNLCYPRAVLSRRSKFRKWKGEKRPPISAADVKALRKVDRIRKKVRDLGKKADLKVKKR